MGKFLFLSVVENNSSLLMPVWVGRNVVTVFSHLEHAHKKFSRVVLLKNVGPLQHSLKGANFVAVCSC